LGSAVEGQEPVYPTMGINDRLGSIGILVAILSALYARERTGEGQMVATSLLGWTINLQAGAISSTADNRNDPRPLERADESDPVYNRYELGDGTWIALGMPIHPERFWPRLCRALDLGELVDDPRFGGYDERGRNHRELIAILDDAFAKLGWEEWVE